MTQKEKKKGSRFSYTLDDTIKLLFLHRSVGRSVVPYSVVVVSSLPFYRSTTTTTQGACVCLYQLIFFFGRYVLALIKWKSKGYPIFFINLFVSARFNIEKSECVHQQLFLW